MRKLFDGLLDVLEEEEEEEEEEEQEEATSTPNCFINLTVISMKGSDTLPRKRGRK
jgi:hypothetical protein